MRRFALSLLSVSFLLFGTACFDIEQDITLNKDQSGTADLKIGIDMEPMIVIMAQMQHEMSGKTGPATKAEIDAAKADFKKQQKAQAAKSGKDKAPDGPIDPKEVEKELPPGIKLLDANVKEQEFGVVTTMKFSFDKLAHLVGVKFPQSKDGDPTKKNVIDSPFEGLEVVDQGKTLTIRTKPTNPAANVEKQTEDSPQKIDPATEKMMKDAFKKMRVAYKITAPYEVVSHNATRKEGNTLIWEYNFDALEKMGNSKKLDDFGVKVVYKK